MLFIKAFRLLAIAVIFLPITGLSVATGMVFSSMLKGMASNPNLDDILYTYTIIAFGFIESFLFILLIVSLILMVL